MKKKIKADSVDELFEIVKAIQNGEEPEAYVKRKAEEEREAQKRRAEEESDAQKRKAEEAAEAKKRRAKEREEAGKQREAAREAAALAAHQKKLARDMEIEDDDEEFERLLADEPEDGVSAAFGLTAEKLAGAGRALRETAQSAAGRAGDFLRERAEKKNHRKSISQRKGTDSQPIQEKQPSADTGQEREQKQQPTDREREQKPQFSDGEQERAHLADTEKNAGGRTHRRYGAKTVSEEAETVGQRILRSLHMESSEEKPAERSTEIIKEGSESNPEKDNPASEKIAGEENELGSIDLDTVQILDRILDGAGTGSLAQESSPGTAVAAGAASQSSEHIVSAEEKEKRHGKLSDLKETPLSPDVKSYLRQLFSLLEEKGIGKKQLQIAGAATVIAAAVLVLILYVLGHTMSLHKKQENVTADAGLAITVESQPEAWCSSGELKLKVKVKSGTISSIEVDGNAYEPDEKGFITVEVQDYLADVVVVTDEETLTAQIEVPMLDSSAPIVSVDKYQGEITVSASDARSGVASIWYAERNEDDWISLPSYQLYTESIPYEEGKIYYFYALDQAGNKSSPIMTTMVTAESLSLSETEITLFPGETAALTAKVSPANAYVAELRYESSNTDVVTVSSSGLVTAVAEGGALIKVTADDLGTVTCSVTVAAEQTVSISVVGDCTLGTYAGANTSTSFDAYYAVYGAAYFFENVRDILENDDITFANLEGTLTDETTPEDKTYAFKGDPSYTEILQDGSIEVVTLANNHSSDYGAQSLIDTKDNLTDAGIAYCIGDTIAYEEVSGVKVAFIGIYELASGMDCESQVRETIAEAQAEDAQLIIVAFHWGTEKETAADETQQSLAHIAVDCGADLVVGHHPHVLQGIEKYNGKYIVYSLGNFCFGGNSNPSDKATMIFRQTFTVSQDGAADDDNIEIIPCTLSSQTSYNDYRPTPATGTTATEIMDRINEYSAAFGDITYTASTGL